jgi:hypothetical protein
LGITKWVWKEQERLKKQKGAEVLVLCALGMKNAKGKSFAPFGYME